MKDEKIIQIFTNMESVIFELKGTFYENSICIIGLDKNQHQFCWFFVSGKL